MVHGVAMGRRRGGAVVLACAGSLCLYLALLLLWPPAGASAAPMTIGQLGCAIQRRHERPDHGCLAERACRAGGCHRRHARRDEHSDGGRSLHLPCALSRVARTERPTGRVGLGRREEPARRDRMRRGLLGSVRRGDDRCVDRHRKPQLRLRRLVGSMHQHRRMPGDGERGSVGDGPVHPSRSCQALVRERGCAR